MRQIKFRGFHTKMNKMFSAEEMAIDQMTLLPTGQFINVHGARTSASTVYPQDKFIPLQFTGLLDKNGKEIYEGDIVQLGTHETLKAVIEFYESGFYQRWLKPNIRTGFDMPAHHGNREPLFSNSKISLHIIGNIYENPELLEPK